MAVEPWTWILRALWLFLPAYAANMAPILAMALLPRWTWPIDAGKVWKDGRRVLGDGKTWRGFVAGAVAGALVALVQATWWRFEPYFSDFALGEAGPTGPLVLGTAFGIGAIVGDAVKSFFKRRTGRQGGAPWPPFDQLDFVVGGLGFAFLAAVALEAAGATARNWWVAEFGRWQVLVVLLVATPFLHFAVNVIGYKLRLKKVPW